MDNCIFCKIAKGEIPSDIVYQDDWVLAFKDIQPAAPVHILVIPKEHIASVNEATPENEQLLGHMYVAAALIAQANGFDESGYRLIVNTNKDAGQEVFHLHMHIMAGRPLGPMLS